ncbi:MAG TPA: MFS transporter [Blastocatellia bacterium]|nr:MFS transporter [Blastocatellia bacterium]HMV84027.1 MFS transporter [Blastocatellia bacterium]HMX26879.1 MFS transporter [Blastocatellia bacterium]HMZ18390.1 MFS transporter [Blastocatellia bacterium]HNG32236.1 MFS transporter [Blastocatellia bacterium]
MSTPAAAPERVLPADPKRSHLARIFHAFTYRDFRLLWFGAFTSSAGTWLQEAALGWILYSLTHKTRYTGFLGFFSTAPILFFTLIGGVIADRIDRRRILLASQWTQLACALALANLAFFQAPTMVLVWSALSLSFLSGCAQAFGGPAYQALIPTLVEKKDLPNAIALNSIQFHLARVVGPTISSIPFAVIGEQLLAAAISFGINGLSFLAVIVALMSLNVRYIPSQTNGGMRSQMLEGLRFVWHKEALRSLTILSFASTFLGMQVTTFFAVFAADIFRTGPTGNAKLIGISGAGAVTGALIVAALGDVQKKGQLALIMQIAFGIAIIAFSLSPTVWLAYPIIFIASVFMMFVFSMIASLVQLIVSDEMRGRVMSIYMLSFRGGAPLGALITGFLAERYPLTRVLMIEGALLSILALAFLLSPSSVKEH